jgi:hydroxymethylpyrimidine/phosphomethylpyrimidine kinase
MAQAAKDLTAFGSANILIKGGHLKDDDSCDLLYQTENKKMTQLFGKRIHTPNSHGTGCTLSSAIAANLAKGIELGIAVKNAKAYLMGALCAGADYQTGKGHGPVHHFYSLWPKV